MPKLTVNALRTAVLIAPMLTGTVFFSSSDAAAEHAHHDPALHADHVAMQSAPGALEPVPPDDPHAHHRAMLEQPEFLLSRRTYQPGDATLVAMNGEEIGLSEALNCGKPVMANFIYTTCTTICPVMSATFAQVNKALGPAVDDVCMVSISIDPEHDTPERLREYAKRFDAGPNWRFFTGDLEDIVAVQKSFDVYRGNKMSHEPTTLMRSAEGGPWLRIDGLASAQDLVDTYRQMMRH